MANTLNKITGSITVLFALLIVCTTVIFYLVAGEAIKTAAPWLIWSGVIGAMAYILIRLYFLLDASRLENKAIRAETANIIVQETLASQRSAFELERDKRFAEKTLEQLTAGLIHPQELDSRTFGSFGATLSKEAAKRLPDQVIGGNLLDEIASLDNLLIIGGKGSGKTSLMQWLESSRQNNGRTIILDSHAQPAQWQGEVVGLGRKYSNIKNAMIWLVGTLQKRYDEFSAGQNDFEPIHQFIDEFTLLPKTLKGIGYDIQDYSIPMLTEGRKVAINCVWGIHSDRAAALGLEGAKDLIECFDAIVKLIHNKETGERYAYINYGEGQTETRYAHPGPFNGQPKQAGLQPQITQVATDEQPRQTIIGLPVAKKNEQPTTEQQIMILHKRELSASTICEKVYGYKNALKVKYVKSVIEAATGAGEK